MHLSLQYYIHYSKEIPDISDKYYSVSENMERDTTFTFWEMTSAPELNRLSPSQRACRFMNEPMDDTIPVYSYNVCRMICRRKLALILCGCIPHFYPYPGISYAQLRNVLIILFSKCIKKKTPLYRLFLRTIHAEIPNIQIFGWVGPGRLTYRVAPICISCSGRKT